MNSSGIRRGLAVTAVSALAVTGVPFLATSAHADPLSDQVPEGVTILSQGYTDPVGAGSPGNHSQFPNTATDSPDGTNSTISLVATASEQIGGVDVTTVTFQYSLDGGTSWNAIGGALTRNADGVFTTEWDAPAAAEGATVDLRAIPNTGEDDATYDQFTVEVDDHAVELETEGDLGYYAHDNGSLNVAVGGTARFNGDAPGQTSVIVYGTIQNAITQTIPFTYGADGTGTFKGILDVSGYPFSAIGGENQISLSGAIDNTEDTEASTLYEQEVTTINAAPDRNPVSPGGNTDVTFTVLDQNGEPVAGAEIGLLADADNDTSTPAVNQSGAWTTDANGEVTVPNVKAGTHTPYVDEDNGDTYQQAIDTEGASFTITEDISVADELTIEPIDRPGETDFDLDELNGAADDFTATLVDQNGQPVDNEGVQYQFVYDDSDTAAADPTELGWNNATTNTDGEIAIPFNDQGPGAYTLQVRRPAGATDDLIEASFEFNAGESEITWADGAEANSPVNGTDTYTGNLSLVEAGEAPLDGREVVVTYTGGDVTFSTDQPAGTTRDNANQVTAVTDENGDFTVSLTDPEAPAGVDPTEHTGTLSAVATGLGAGDAANEDAAADLTVNFRVQPTVSNIEIDVQDVFDFEPFGPGKPAEIQVTVEEDSPGTPDDTSDDTPVADVPVTVSVNGDAFLSPDPNAGDSDENDLVLDEENNAEGDLFGFYEDLGQSQELDSGDSGSADVFAAIERSEDFDDDGLAEVEVTVTAGDVTVTETVEFTTRESNYLNIGDLRLERDGDEPTGDVEVPGEVDFKLYAEDQYGNLVQELATVSDDTPVADVTISDTPPFALNGTVTDYANETPGITASSETPVLQTIQAQILNAHETLVDADGNPDFEDRAVTEQHQVNWVEDDGTTPPDGDGRTDINVNIKGKNRGKIDLIIARAPRVAADSTVRLFRKRNGEWSKIQTRKLNKKGDFRFRVRDLNGKRITRYRVIVKKDANTSRARSRTLFHR